jgi:apolipoprotein D and lipocalin family protein
MINILFAAAAVLSPLPNTPIETLDLERYKGRWHEIARLPQPFQKKCVRDVTADYVLQPKGKIEVTNRCVRADGSQIVAIGQARKTKRSPAALQVRFAPAFLAALPFVWADYWVVELDPDYRWAVIGNPNHKYLWILSRSPSLEPSMFETIVKRTAARGYATDKLLIADIQSRRQ